MNKYTLNKQYIILVLLSIFLLTNCNKKEEAKTLFELKNNTFCGINFLNKLTDTNDFNVYKYRNYYNGGGVAIGDVNNDGLVDIYMVANQGRNTLYLNKGNWKFEDITDKSKCGGQKAWSTGVTMVDINGDGFLDIYVCNSGDVKGDNKENELFINNGDLTFTESAADYGLNDAGFSTHAAFFDYDKDGDLDAYILNNSFQAIGSFNLSKNERPVRDALGGDKLMENRNGKFVDVSEKAGIYGSVIGFGLGITIGDVNNDSWEDIYISNDFFERDYLYINQKNGTFKEDLVNQMPATSAASMGADIADIDNDGFNDIFVTDMLPSEYQRLKTVTTFDSWDRYMLGVNNGYHHQFTRNTLQKNNGNGTFSDIGRFTGTDASDWSWGALFFDMDNDGLKDLFIANGIYRDITDQDYLQYIANESVMASIIKDEGVDYKKLIDIIPSRPVANHAYKNAGNNHFSDFESSGLKTPGFSNGSAYGDLDNDGDLDLIVNNVNMPCFVYENKADESSGNNYLKLDLRGEGKNSRGIGTRIKITDENGQSYYFENQPARGFESTVDHRVNAGLGKAKSVNVEVTWPSGKVTALNNQKVNQIVIIYEKDAKKAEKTVTSNQPQKLMDISTYMPYRHVENAYIDFNRERLNYHLMSTRGPVVGSGDVNGDGMMDIVIPGPKGFPTKIYVGTQDGKFKEQQQDETYFEVQKEAEHVICHLFDADKDGDLDLYLASGGVELTEYSEYLYDALLINDGKGHFTPSGQRLPVDDAKVSTGAVVSSDIDRDGDLDLFVGERVKIGQYGAACSGYLLINDGKGKFTNETSARCSVLQNIGMITDAIFSDLDNDGSEDLVVVGEFMKVSVFANKNGKFEAVKMGGVLNGWWNTIKTSDIDNDGDQDIILGNHGLNSRFKADEKHPIKMYYRDFDSNGEAEGILANVHSDGKTYPYALRHNLMTRIPGLKKQYPNFDSFKNATMEDIFTKEGLKSSLQWTVDELRSIILVNDGKFNFTKRVLPNEVQYSPVYAIGCTDVNGDCFQDLIFGGNLYGVQPEVGRYDASYGNILMNNGKGHFVDRSKEYGFSVKGEIRDFYIDKSKIFVFRNNDTVKGFQINN